MCMGSAWGVHGEYMGYDSKENVCGGVSNTWGDGVRVWVGRMWGGKGGKNVCGGVGDMR